jgi:hypothetical protein
MTSKSDGLEKQLQKEIVESLRKRNCSCEEYFPCSIGNGDIIVTGDSVIEVKYLLTRDTLFKAIGQVLLYRKDIEKTRELNKQLTAKIIYGRVTEDLEDMIDIAREIGVEVTKWDISSDLDLEHLENLLRTMESLLEDLPEPKPSEVFIIPENKAYSIGKEYLREKGPQGGNKKSKDDVKKAESKNTAERLAAKYGLSERTVRKYGEIAEAVDDIATLFKNKNVYQIILSPLGKVLFGYDDVLNLANFLLPDRGKAKK